MNYYERKKCHEIIHFASLLCASVGAGLAQVPGSDNAAITPIQLAMVVSLGKVFDCSISESSAKAAVASATAGVIGRTASQILLGWIPVLGNAINATTAAGLTEAVGWIIAKEFDEGLL